MTRGLTNHLALLIAALLVSAVGLVPRVARGADAELTPAEAERVTALVAEAQRLRDTGDWEAAADRLHSAIALYPSASLYYNLGRVYDDAGQPALARVQYQLALGKAPSGDVRELASQGLARTEALLATGHLRLEGLPEGATVLVDGTPRGTAPLAAPLSLATGRHAVRVSLEGHHPHETVVEIRGAQESILTVALRPLGDTPAPAGSVDGAPGEGSGDGPRLFHLGLLVGEGIAIYDAEVYRSKVSIELLPSLHFDWLRVDLGATLLVEPEMGVLLRPGVRFALGSFYLRPAFQLIVTPVLCSGMLVGAGSEVELGSSWSLLAEIDISLWFGALAVVPLEARLGVSYGF